MANPEWKRITVIPNALTSRDLNVGNAVGTGLLCGADSFCTIYGHLECEAEYRIQYFTFLNAGSHGEYGGEAARSIYQARLQSVSQFVSEQGISPIPVDSNISELLQMKHQLTHTVRNVACALNLQKLLRNYYYASAYRFDSFQLTEQDSAYYDLPTLSMLSTESTVFYSAVSRYTRVEKVEIISGFEPTYRYLHVCNSLSSTSVVRNCSVCDKCMRTLVTLELLRKLRLYDRVFDIDAYTLKRNRYLAQALLIRRMDQFSGEIVDLIRRRKCRISPIVYLYCVPVGVELLAKKLLRMMQEGPRPMRVVAATLLAFYRSVRRLARRSVDRDT